MLRKMYNTFPKISFQVNQFLIGRSFGIPESLGLWRHMHGRGIISLSTLLDLFTCCERINRVTLRETIDSWLDVAMH